MISQNQSPILLFNEGISFGHTARSLTIARWIKPLGYSIIIACPEKASKLFASEGFETVIINIAEPAKIFERLRYGRPMYKTEEVLEYYKQDDELIQRIKPRMIVSDFRFSALQLAKKYNIPCVSIMEANTHPNFVPDFSLPDPYAKPTFIPIEILDFFSQKTPVGKIIKASVEADLSKPMQEASRAYGLEVLPKYYHYLANADLCLLADHPTVIPVNPLRPQDVYIGAILWESSEPLPPEISLLNPNQKTIYICPGTQDALSTDFIVPYVNELLKHDMQVIVSKGKRSFDIPIAHPKLLVYDFINDSKLLSKVDLVVFPGGIMTIYQGLYNTVPLIGLPAHANQLFQSQAIKRNNIGCYIRPSRLKVKNLMKETLRLLKDPNVKASLENIQSQLKTLNGREIAVNRIKALLDSTAPKHEEIAVSTTR